MDRLSPVRTFSVIREIRCMCRGMTLSSFQRRATLKLSTARVRHPASLNQSVRHFCHVVHALQGLNGSSLMQTRRRSLTQDATSPEKHFDNPHPDSKLRSRYNNAIHAEKTYRRTVGLLHLCRFMLSGHTCRAYLWYDL